MTRPPEREKRLRRSLDDCLRKQQRDYAWREFLRLQPTSGKMLWGLRLAPYPLDADTAAAVRFLAENQVLPWGALEPIIQEWAYHGFFEKAVASEVCFNRTPRAQAEAAIPDLETLRGYIEGWIPQPSGEQRADDFEDECDIVRSMIREGLLADVPALAGRFVYMPSLPLGAPWLSRVPLLDGTWIDRRVVELSEASAHLEGRGYTRLPAVDRHSLAWHRFYPPGTRWTSPRPAPRACLAEALGKAVGLVRRMRMRVRQFGGRDFLHVDDYVRVGNSRVTEALVFPGGTEEGIAVRRWNDWVWENGEGGRVNLCGTQMSPIASPWGLREREGIEVFSSLEDAEIALAERNEGLGQLCMLGMQAAARADKDFTLSPLQVRILEALKDEALHTDSLAGKSHCERRTLFKPGGIKELKKLGLVANDRKAGGFHLTSAGRECLRRRAQGESGHTQQPPIEGKTRAPDGH